MGLQKKTISTAITIGVIGIFLLIPLSFVMGIIAGVLTAYLAIKQEKPNNKELGGKIGGFASFIASIPPVTISFIVVAFINFIYPADPVSTSEIVYNFAGILLGLPVTFMLSGALTGYLLSPKDEKNTQ